MDIVVEEQNLFFRREQEFYAEKGFTEPAVAVNAARLRNNGAEMTEVTGAACGNTTQVP